MIDVYDHKTKTEMFDGHEVSPILPYYKIDADAQTIKASTQASGRISISGVQPKYAMIVDDGQLRFAKEGEQGLYILKIAPIEIHLLERPYVPINEWLTMHIAEQVYHIPTAQNCLCYFGNGEVAYLTKRFDVLPDGSKISQEDFASIAKVSKETHGEDYKYTALSYEDFAPLINRYVNAAPVEMLKFFRLILFNYITCNDDAHLKNFSLLSYDGKDYVFTPAYDLVNTYVHLAEPHIFALTKGLYNGMIIDDTHSITGRSFVEFGHRLGLPDKLIERELNFFRQEYPRVREMIESSDLSNSLKSQYFNAYDYHRRTLSFNR